MEISKNRYIFPAQPDRFQAEMRSKFNVTDRLPTEWNEVLDTTEKERLFTPCLEVMSTIAQRKGYSLPSDLADRLHIVDQDVYQRATQEYELPWLKNAVGLSLPNRHSLINAQAVETLASRTGKRDLYYQLVGTHELWHSVDYREFWLTGLDQTKPVKEVDLYRQQRRWGIYTARPNTTPVLAGLGGLMEGFTEYRTREVIRALNPGIDYSQYGSYASQLEHIDYLVMFFRGDQSLYDASFTGEGFHSLVRNIKKYVGTGMLKQFR